MNSSALLKKVAKFEAMASARVFPSAKTCALFKSICTVANYDTAQENSAVPADNADLYLLSQCDSPSPISSNAELKSNFNELNNALNRLTPIASLISVADKIATAKGLLAADYRAAYVEENSTAPQPQSYEPDYTPFKERPIVPWGGDISYEQPNLQTIYDPWAPGAAKGKIEPDGTYRHTGYNYQTSQDPSAKQAPIISKPMAPKKK
jgi:hypothetical protein